MRSQPLSAKADKGVNVQMCSLIHKVEAWDFTPAQARPARTLSVRAWRFGPKRQVLRAHCQDKPSGPQQEERPQGHEAQDAPMDNIPAGCVEERAAAPEQPTKQPEDTFGEILAEGG